jgi:protein dithiol:quinone oxidoreductase
MQISTRRLWSAAALSCAFLAAASVAMTAWLHLSPCHLCIFQRLLFMVLALLAAVAALAPRHGLVRRLSGGLFAATAAGGIGVAAYQSWLQAHASASFSCGGGQPNLIERLVNWLGERIPDLFLATGFCEDEAVVILGLSLANWALVSFAVFLASAAWALWVDRRTGP